MSSPVVRTEQWLLFSICNDTFVRQATSLAFYALLVSSPPVFTSGSLLAKARSCKVHLLDREFGHAGNALVVLRYAL
jgi:hypothetical protein